MHIDRSWLKNLLDHGTILTVGVPVIAEFYNVLDALHWFPQSLDWRAMPPADSFELAAGNDEAALAWIKQMQIGRHSHIVVTYRRDEPGVLCTADVFVCNIGSLFASAPGKSYMFGASRVANDWEYDFDSIMEFDGGGMLTAVK
jgi:hypothetical protein